MLNQKLPRTNDTIFLMIWKLKEMNNGCHNNIHSSTNRRSHTYTYTYRRRQNESRKVYKRTYLHLSLYNMTSENSLHEILVHTRCICKYNSESLDSLLCKILSKAISEERSRDDIIKQMYPTTQSVHKINAVLNFQIYTLTYTERKIFVIHTKYVIEKELT